MKQVNVFQAKTDLSKLIAELEDREEDSIVIARGKKPLAVLTLYKAPSRVKLGLFDGKYEIPDDFDDEDEEILKLMGVI